MRQTSAVTLIVSKLLYVCSHWSENCSSVSKYAATIHILEDQQADVWRNSVIIWGSNSSCSPICHFSTHEHIGHFTPVKTSYCRVFSEINIKKQTALRVKIITERRRQLAAVETTGQVQSAAGATVLKSIKAKKNLSFVTLCPRGLHKSACTSWHIWRERNARGEVLFGQEWEGGGQSELQPPFRRGPEAQISTYARACGVSHTHINAIWFQHYWMQPRHCER